LNTVAPQIEIEARFNEELGKWAIGSDAQEHESLLIARLR